MAHIRKLPPRSGERAFRYQVRYLDGRAKERARTFPTRDQATAFMHSVETAKRSGEAVVEPITMTVAQWSDLFVEHQNWRESTRSQQRSRLDSHILPALGELRLSDVRARDLRSLVRSWERSSMSHQTVRACTSLLRSLFSAAVDEDVLPSSPAAELRHRSQGRQKRRQVLSLADVEALRSEMPTAQHALFLALLAGTGMRVNEARSLTINRLALDASPPAITVDRQLLPRRSTPAGGSFGPLKSSAFPERTVAITRELAVALREHVGERPGGSFVFESSHFAGHAMGSRSLTEVWQRAADRAGIDRALHPGWHSLRHHHASRLLSSRSVSVAAVQQRLGHSSATVTLTVYTHAWETSDEQVLGVLEGPDTR